MEDNLKDLFISYGLAKELKELGFDKECIAYFAENKELQLAFETFVKWCNLQAQKYCDLTNSNVVRVLNKDCVTAPTWEQSFKFFRDKYDLHVQIRKENYICENFHMNYFHFDISKGEKNDITKQEDLYFILLQECSQDVPGNYLNDKKLNSLIFEKKFAFKTYEETRLFCLKKLIEIVKNEEQYN